MLRGLKTSVEARIGRELTRAASTYPPGVPVSEVWATRYVLEAAGLDCSVLVDEPSAANAVLAIANGAVVDVGGGTTGLAVIEDDEVTYTADEPTGGKHLTLVLAGHFHITLDEAERPFPSLQRVRPRDRQAWRLAPRGLVDSAFGGVNALARWRAASARDVALDGLGRPRLPGAWAGSVTRWLRFFMLIASGAIAHPERGVRQGENDSGDQRRGGRTIRT